MTSFTMNDILEIQKFVDINLAALAEHGLTLETDDDLMA